MKKFSPNCIVPPPKLLNSKHTISLPFLEIPVGTFCGAVGLVCRGLKENCVVYLRWAGRRARAGTGGCFCPGGLLSLLLMLPKPCPSRSCDAASRDSATITCWLATSWSHSERNMQVPPSGISKQQSCHQESGFTSLLNISVSSTESLCFAAHYLFTTLLFSLESS